MSETTMAASIPENALPPEPEYITKKKFCFAAIPSILAVFGAAFISFIFFLDFFAFFETSEVSDKLRWIFCGTAYATEAVAMLALSVMAFIKINNPLTSAPLFVAASGCFTKLLVSVFTRLYPNEFEVEFEPKRFEHFSYSDYITVLAVSWVSEAILAAAFIAAAVYIILAARKNAGEKIRKLWFVPCLMQVPYVLSRIVYNVVFFVLYCSDLIKYDRSMLSSCLASVTGGILSALVWLPQFVAIILLCKWVSNPYKKVLKKVPEPKKEKEKAEVKEEIKEEKKPEPVAPPKPPKPVAPPPARPVAPPPARPVAPPPKKPAPMQAPVMKAPPVSAPVPPNQVATMAQKNNIELIRQYKELLDMGAITQEEFDEKKKELLTNQ